MNTIVRIGLADDHPIVLAGLRNLISAEADLKVVGEAVDGLAALEMLRREQPDVAVIDMTMPQLNGMELTKRLVVECPSVRVLLLTLHEERAYVRRALEAGARGYALKRTAAEHLIKAIRAVYIGGIYLDPMFAGRTFNKRDPRPLPEDGLADELTEREVAVLKLSAAGLTSKEIAYRLSVSHKSVETYKRRGMERLGFRTRSDLVRYAAIQGWLAQS